LVPIAAATTVAAAQPALHSDYLLSTILGIIEGLTEFLPVSSTAHLRLAEAFAQHYHLTDIDISTPYWKMYSIVIQLGAILSLPVYFLRRILKFLGTFPTGERGDRNIITHPLSLTMIAFVVTAGPTYFLTKKIGENLDNFYVIGGALFIGGIVMWIVDAIFGKPRVVMHRSADALTATMVNQGKLQTTTAVAYESKAELGHRTEHMEEMRLWQAVWIGICQIASAVFPGTSRSMSTIAAGQVAGMSRAAALEFSFFVSIPTMFAATLFTLKKALFPKPGQGDAFSPKSMSRHDWIVLAIGFGVSFIVALGVVAWFMAWVRRRGFTPFAIYRIILGAGVLYLAYTGFLSA
jgi:undecaprenyl-diphosphatase